jgi:hypothetical protein
VPDAIRIETPDGARAAYLMQRLVGRVRTRLTEHDECWEIVVDSEPEPMRRLDEVLAAVQHWVDDDTTTNRATISFRTQVRTIDGSTLPAARPCVRPGADRLPAAS